MNFRTNTENRYFGQFLMLVFVENNEKDVSFFMKVGFGKACSGRSAAERDVL
jgi:hypothetical protein